MRFKNFVLPASKRRANGLVRNCFSRIDPCEKNVPVIKILTFDNTNNFEKINEAVSGTSLEYIPIRPSREGRKTLTLRVIIEPEGTTRVEVLDPSESPPPEEVCSQ